MNKKKLENNIKKFYLHRILSGMFFAVPIMVLFWQENGLSLTEVMLLQSLFAIVTVVLEIPTGYFADVKGRRKTLFYSAVSTSIAISIYSFAESFLHFAIGEVFFALAVSLSSGTLSALVFDSLQDLGRTHEYPKIWGNSIFYGMISLALSNAVGGFIGEVNLRYALFASVPAFLLLIPVALSMEEPRKHKDIVKEGYTQELIRIMKFALVENKKLRWIIIYSGIVYAFNQSALWLYQPYFKLTGLEVAHFGIVFASFQLVSGFSSKYAHSIERKLGQKYSLAMLIILVSASYFLMHHFVYLFSFSFCFIQQFVRGFKKAVVNDYINQLATSNIRATILSLESFASRLLYAAIVPVVGWVADIYTLSQALLILGSTALVSGIVIFAFLRKFKIF
ncbi:hypothetical protein A9Q84_13690 [Halobacteriovorax marinus]|uniref:Major facilitator superfamily (MFS) profile domain-containing protein n=1 Tax=Halobacteriovorax marinus TaxID=97084 RepID=A0A1Y5FFI5_9BACT|nr:hypothetical protein A9Q84_13690 [Halobacteriovorax marinus]